jgi:pyrroline-5-carboxylate reductase
MQIAFIGSGVMAEAMIRGILDKGLAIPPNLVASDINSERGTLLNQRYGLTTTSDNCSAAKEAEVIVLAVQPHSLAGVMRGLGGHVQPEQLVLSIVAGANISIISQGLGHKTIVRAMPNMPASIGEGVSIWTATSEVSEIDKDKARSILGTLGKELFVGDERYIDMATAVSGSGPAYIFVIIESLIDAAVYIGLPHELAKELVLQTVLGATHLAQIRGKHPAELRDMVTSPGGTTAEGLLQLEQGGLRATLSRAIIAGYKKAKDLGGEA